MSLREALRIRESEVTDEAVYRDRRRLLALMAAASAVLDAVAKTCDRARPDAGRDRSRRVTEAACRLRRAALARAAIP